MITVRDVATAASLQLTVVAGAGGLDREVTSAHVSELISPGDWLRGGELLMTVGLLLPMIDRDCRRYVSECATAGVAALAIGVGHGLPYRDCPQPLRDAADAVGIPMLVVPDQTPFIGVTKWVFETIARQERRGLQQAMENNRRLTAVATSSAPLPALLSAWAATSATPCVVCDGAAGLVAASPGTSPDTVDQARATCAQMDGRSWAVIDGFEVHTIGAGVPLAYVVLGADMDAAARASSTVLVSLIAVDRERRELSDEPERRRREQVLGQLLRTGVKRERARQLAAGVGLTAEHCHVAVVGGAGEELAFRLRATLDGALVRVHAKSVEVVHWNLAALTDTLQAHAGGLPTGIGAATSPETLGVSVMQARSLVAVSRRLGRIVSAGEGETVSLLLSLGEPEAVRGFADAVLAPLDQLEPGERVELLRTLDQWLRVNGAWDPAAARLSVHRNTVRNRVDRIAQLTGRRLDDGDDRMELWLALKARTALP
ncbi:PucR family transcriptional regulator [Mycobacterium sp. BMJ-28]